ncbi:MAG: ATP-binding protein [Clostridium sp.]
MFQQFYRADASRTSSTGGSGLGLSIVEQIISAHGGKVWAESVEGVGTSIIFTLKKAKNTDLS